MCVLENSEKAVRACLQPYPTAHLSVEPDRKPTLVEMVRHPESYPGMHWKGRDLRGGPSSG